LLDHKERGALGLARPLGAALAAAVRAGLAHGAGTEHGGAEHGGAEHGGADGAVRERGAGGRVDEQGAGGRVQEPGAVVALVPMPSAPQAVRARGHDPTLRIARAAAAGLRGSGVRARVLAVLRQRRTPADQAGLDARERLANVAGALEVTRGGAAPLTEVGRIVLVDDLMTTGASLAEAARAVRAAMPPGTRSVTMRGGADSGQGMPGGIAFGAAVIAASPDSFEINRN
ncbi:ComF family protein, partial [Streptomyces sp. SID5785]|uniref:ComF family protein n=1 Tax=Streptomyces sp. SID5785 TaxID=2690309 RepID=UPI001360C667